jgi:co-chaperonin GroES (HSP10)
MKSLFDFIVEPYGQRYNNKVKVGDKSLIINTQVETFKSVNNIAKVIEVPLSVKTVIKKGDLIMIHHNVFRRWYNIRGEEKNSKSFFKDNLYFVQPDQIYLYKNNDRWHTVNDRCFISPIKNTDNRLSDQEQYLIGVLKYGNSALEVLEINEGDLVGYKPFGEYDFVVEGKRLYCMKSNDIVIKYERQGNEVEYNPSWAQSS